MNEPIGRTFHLSQSIRGAIRNWKTLHWKKATKWCTRDDGSRFDTGEQVREAFLDELAKGNEFLPMGPCDNFDPKKGCLGHLKDSP